jgi:hypothetical protein
MATRKKDSPVQSSRSLNWGWNLAFVEKRFFQEATGKANLKCSLRFRNAKQLADLFCQKLADLVVSWNGCHLTSYWIDPD